MITKLTKAQESKFKSYVDKWLTVGLSTDRLNLETCKPIVDNFYKKILNKPTVPIIIMDSPLTAWFATLYVGGLFNGVDQVRDQVWNQVENKVWNKVENKVWNQVWNQVENKVRKEVRDQVENQVWNQVENKVWNQVRDQVENKVWKEVENQVWNQVENKVWKEVRDQVENQVWNQVENKVWNKVRNQFPNFIWPYLAGNLWASWFSFYDFLFEEVIELKTKLFNDFKELSKLHLIYPLDQACVLSQKPTEIHMKDGVLHNSNGASIKYADGFSVYSLNGIQMKEEHILTPTEKMTPEMVMKEENVDVRRELIRKFGVDRLKEFGKRIDKDGDYELLDMEKVFTSVDYAPHLLMKNPSIGVYHSEGVHPDCRTVREAINWRAGDIKKNWNPSVLT